MTKSDTTDQDVADRWNANADQWTADVRAGYDTYRDLFTWPAFQDFLGDVSGLDVVDFGCGEGTNTRRLAAAGARMTGIDLSDRQIAHARAAEADAPLDVSYYKASFSQRTPFPDGSFDRVISTLALMDGPDLPGTMHEAFRLLKPDGILAFSVLHPCHISPGLRWEKNQQGNTTGLVVDRYHDRTAFTEEWRFSARSVSGSNAKSADPFLVPRFPRTLSDWINAVSDAGFIIEQMEEPVPDANAIRQQPRFARWRDQAAFLLMIRARRPASSTSERT